MISPIGSYIIIRIAHNLKSQLSFLKPYITHDLAQKWREVVYRWEGVTWGCALPETHLWKGHSLYPIPLSVKEEWYCRGSYGNVVECVV